MTKSTYPMACLSGITIAAVMLLSLGGNVLAGTLENLERERALLIETILDPSLGPADRQSRITAAKARLVDLERMVLRDRNLRGRNTPTVRRAFENYDLTFLAHAALEKNVTITDLWFEQMGITTAKVMSADVRRR